MEFGGSRINAAMKIVVEENPTSATAFFPYFTARNVEQSTPTTVTNWLDILKRLNPTEATLERSALTTRPKTFNR